MRPAQPQHPSRGRRRLDAAKLSLLCLLLAVPVYAVSRVHDAGDRRFLAGVAIVASVVAWFLYRSDKRAAELGRWRIPESTLQGFALLGGWPGAFLAQHWFRHKTSKLSFQIAYWLIVAVHQSLAFDSLRDWPLTRRTFALVVQYFR